MEIKIIEEKKNRIVFEIDEDDTFLNVLKEALYEDPSVEAASYAKEHPEISLPKFIVECKGEEPRKVLINAAKKVEKEFKKFEELTKELK